MGNVSIELNEAEIAHVRDSPWARREILQKEILRNAIDNRDAELISEVRKDIPDIGATLARLLDRPPV